MLADDDRSQRHDVEALMEMTHETMMARWELGLVTPMSATISTFAKTDGSWWTAAEQMWRRVSLAEENKRLDFHHDRFGSNVQAAGPPQSLFGGQSRSFGTSA
ncbi:hypothetical protein AB0H43_11445 [Hamadaea sp. NPDC050747]|uniref:hypothetical protein n=1 Tax=Hamadaea sp. NPDC050747 TaxID=3155789 RepID=UPI0033DD5511